MAGELRQIGEIPSTGVRINGATGIRNLGIGQGSGQVTQEAVQTVRGAASRLEQISTEQLNRANRIRAMEVSNQLFGLTSDIANKAQQQYRGKDAAGASDLIGELDLAFQKKIAPGLMNQAQLDMAQAEYMRRRATLEQQLKTHEHQELRKHENTEALRRQGNGLKAAVVAALNASEGWQGVVAMELSQVAEVEVHKGRAARLSDETIQSNIEAVRSKGHAEVLRALVNSKRVEDAKAYAEAVKDELDPQVRAQFEGEHRTAEIMLRAERLAEQMVETMPRDEALKLIRDQYEGEEQDTIYKRVDWEYAERKRQEALAADEHFQKVERLVADHPGRLPQSVIPPSDWKKLSLKERGIINTLAGFPHGRHPGSVKATKDAHKKAAWAWLYNQIDTDEKKKAFAEMPYVDFLGKVSTLSPSDLEEALKLRKGVISELSKPDTAKAARSAKFSQGRINQLAKSTWLALGVDVPGARSSIAEKDRYGRYQDALNREIRDREARGEVIDESSAQKIIDGLVKQTVTIDRLFKDREVSALRVGTQEARRAYVPVSKISEKERAFAEQLLMQAEKRFDDKTVSRVVAALRMKDRTLLNELLSSDD